MILTLPFPPSTNSIWRSVKGRNIKSKAYREWEKAAGWGLREVRGGWSAMAGPVSVRMVLGRPDKRKRDLDNYLKAPLDLIVSNGIIMDDSQVHHLEAIWCDTMKNMEITVNRL